MRAYVLPATLLIALASGSASFAAYLPVAKAPVHATKAAATMMKTETVTGQIKAFSLKRHTLTLQNGAVFHFASSLKHPSFKVGEKVSISYHMQGKRHVAETIGVAA